MNNTLNLFFLSIFVFIFIFSSCTSHVFLSSSQCRPSDSLILNDKVATWHTLRTTDARYFREAKIQNFWGTTFYPKEKGALDLCDLSFHQRANEVRISTRFTFKDVLWGLIPGNSMRTVEVSGVFEKELDASEKSQNQSGI